LYVGGTSSLAILFGSGSGMSVRFAPSIKGSDGISKEELGMVYLIKGSAYFTYTVELATDVTSDTGFLPLSLFFLRYFCLSDSNLAFFLSSSAAEGGYGLTVISSSLCSIVLSIVVMGASCSV